MISLSPSRTLFSRTALALAFAFLLFGTLAVALLQYTVVLPHMRQAADDLASFLVLVAQIWVELPPKTRADYEKELLEKHQIKVITIEAPDPSRTNFASYLHYLSDALSKHVSQPVYIHSHPDHPGWFWADFPMGGRTMRLGFKADRARSHVFGTLPWLAALGLFIAFVVSVLLVRRITRPLAKMSEAAGRIGEGDFSINVSESEPREIAELARRLNRMEKQIRQLVENRTTLLAGISHDLRTPLARMGLELEMLGGEKNHSLVEGMRSDIAEMDRLISQTLLLARGFRDEEPAKVDVGELLDQLAGDFTKTGAVIQVEVTSPCERSLRVNAFKRAVSNLLENALNYGGNQPVVLGCKYSSNGIDVRVADSGPGIPAGERDAVFEPFHRLEGSRNRRTGGSGLGLAIVKQLCDGNGWTVAISDRPEGGSVFTLHIPADSDMGS